MAEDVDRAEDADREETLADEAQWSQPAFTRREILKLIGGTAALAVGPPAIGRAAWDYVRWTEDFFPGTAPTDVLEPNAWAVSDDAAVFGVVGDTGTGGRNQMAVAQAMVDAYKQTPYGFVAHVGDISYYGSFEERRAQVWDEPYRSLFDAGVQMQVALGNHELEESSAQEVARGIQRWLEEDQLEHTYRVERWGPVDFFLLDTSTPLITAGRVAAEEQVQWLDEALTDSTATWKVGVMHHSPYGSSPKRGSFLEIREAVEPLFIKHGVQLSLAGHDHLYERTHPQNDVTYVISGAGAKLSDIGFSNFTAHAAKVLQFMIVEVDGRHMKLKAIDTTGTVFDQVTIDNRGRVVA